MVWANSYGFPQTGVCTSFWDMHHCMSSSRCWRSALVFQGAQSRRLLLRNICCRSVAFVSRRSCDKGHFAASRITEQPVDKTPPPLGKFWIFDSFKLRVPSTEWKYGNVTRFLNVFKVDGKNRGLLRSWGHLSMSEDDINKCIQLLRAFVRPVHGEIWIIKKDGHPTHRSEAIVSNLIDATILNQTSPPYVHEGVGASPE